HAHVGENDSNIVFEQQFERLAAGPRFDQVFAQFGEDDLVGKQFSGLIVDHQHVHFFFCAHLSFSYLWRCRQTGIQDTSWSSRSSSFSKLLIPSFPITRKSPRGSELKECYHETG